MNEENNLSDSDKKAILRSAAYPNITIEEALTIVSQIKKSFPTSQFDREDVAAALKRTNITRDIGAAVQYGLLDKAKGQGYKLASRVQSILNFVTDQERTEALIDCFRTPKLYADLIERFKGHAVPGDQQLRAIVIRYHGITEAAAPQAMDIFIQNAFYCGALNENRILFGENNTEKPLINLEDKPNNLPKATLLLEEINGTIDLKIHLSEKKIARLIYPEKMNEKDIQILKLQLEALALTL
ncbi:MAG TPA: hypothetical protein VIJ27_12210 [Mucilaginibacter sp.]